MRAGARCQAGAHDIMVLHIQGPSSTRWRKTPPASSTSRRVSRLWFVGWRWLPQKHRPLSKSIQQFL